jgi:Tol biopolymer transport system component
MINTNHIFLTVTLVLTNVFLFSQGLPIKPTRTISFTTDEGSYMDVDISPDGKTIVVDLLGDLYTVPVTGGNATQLTRGMALHIRPVWSPDGK